MGSSKSRRRCSRGKGEGGGSLAGSCGWEGEVCWKNSLGLLVRRIRKICLSVLPQTAWFHEDENSQESPTVKSSQYFPWLQKLLVSCWLLGWTLWINLQLWLGGGFPSTIPSSCSSARNLGWGERAIAWDPEDDLMSVWVGRIDFNGRHLCTFIRIIGKLRLGRQKLPGSILCISS